MRSARQGRWDWDVITWWAPVVGVAAVSQAKLGLEEPWTGSDAVLTVTALLHAAPLLARRRWPVVTAGLVAAAAPVQVALGGALSFGTFVAVLVASYSVGRYAAPRAAVAGAAIVLVGIVLATLDALPQDAPELVFPFFYVSAAASIGAVVKRLDDQAHRLEELNAALARERDATVRLAVASERMRLSRDLHDSVAHVLTVAVVQAEKCEQAITADPGAAAAAAVAIQDSGRQGLAELRSVLRVLRDPELPVREPGLADLGALATVVSESGLEVTVTSSGDPAAVPEAVGHQLFRVVQESLTNVLKHSSATTAEVRIAISPGSVALDVVDPGPPSTGALPPGGHGVTVMTERLAGLGGELSAAADGRGFRVRATVPLPALVDA